jgi:hypothetical protein
LLDRVLEDPALNEKEILATEARRIWAAYDSSEDVPREGNP